MTTEMLSDVGAEDIDVNEIVRDAPDRVENVPGEEEGVVEPAPAAKTIVSSQVSESGAQRRTSQLSWMRNRHPLFARHLPPSREVCRTAAAPLPPHGVPAHPACRSSPLAISSLFRIPTYSTCR